MEKYIFIAIGGAFGSMARYWIGSTVASRVGTKIPYGTFLINMLACTVIGFSVTLLSRHVGWNPAWRLLVPVGFVGAFSTFSTYEWETFSNIRNGAVVFAIAYAIGSLVLGFAAVWGGSSIAEWIS